jgi:flagellin
MSLRINQNISAYSAHRFLSANDASMAKSIERLSSGLRINSAADDAAGLVISENLRTQVSGLTQATKNSQDAVNMIKTAEAALNEVELQLRNIRDLTLHSANSNGNSQMLAADQAQVDQALDSIDRIADQTEFAGVKLLGTQNISGKSFQIGANAAQQATFNVTGVTYDSKALTADMHASSLALNGDAKNAVVTGRTAFKGLTGGNLETVNITQQLANGDSATVFADLTAANAGDLATAITTINTAIAAGDISAGTNNLGTTLEAIATDASGTVQTTASLNTYISIRSKTVGQQAANSTITVTSDKATYNYSSGFDTPLTGSGRAANAAIDLTTATTSTDFDAILAKVDDALKVVNGLRVNLGAFQKNNLESNLASLAVSKENIAASESAIRDTDMASEMVNFTKNQILMQAGQAMLTQANQAPQNILQMLRG